MKNNGKIFEEDLKNSAKAQGIWIMRLNDTSLSWEKEKNARFTPSNIADFLIFKKPNLYVIECKSTRYKSMSFQRTPEHPKAMIKASQIKNLIDVSLVDGINSGMILNFRNDDDVSDNITYWFPIKNFVKFLCDEDKNSINKSDCEKYGAIVVDQKLKRTRYSYDIEKMLNDINNIKDKGW